MNRQTRSELIELLNALCEAELTHEQSDRIEQIVTDSPDAMVLYLDFMNLHGNLFWDTAHDQESAGGLDPADATESRNQQPRLSDSTGNHRARSTPPDSRQRPRRIVSAVAAAGVLLATGWTLWSSQESQSKPDTVSIDSSIRADDSNQPDRSFVPGRGADRRFQAVELAGPPAPGKEESKRQADVERPSEATSPLEFASVTEGIDHYIATGWQQANVIPSAIADDSEWIRRIYLDLVGHVPPPDRLVAFLRSESPDKRALLVDELLDSSEYVTNMSTVWTNLLIGRAPKPGVDRGQLMAFLRRSFDENRPWNDIVYDLISAEGRADENGATNFLVAHVNNQAVPATAITARLFLGTEIHCTQCHSHPFNDQQQNAFWELNGFFKQTRLVQHRETDATSGKRRLVGELIRQPVGGPTFYETRQQLLKMAYPRFAGVTIDDGEDVNRRAELARLMTRGDQQQAARAMVNRVWSQLFGYGFTHSVTDMGPHSQESHPELLNLLTEAFVASRYDLKQLFRWICNSHAYQLSSRFSDGNQSDQPEATGELPLFSHMYLKPMSAEQVYDSVMVATGARKSVNADHYLQLSTRDQWIQQFVFDYATDENDESNALDGSMTQALVMMNSELIQQAIQASRGSYLQDVLNERSSDGRKIEQLCLAALSRYPTAEEERQLRSHLQASRRANRREGAIRGYEDVFWAYLNSSEFLYVH